MVRVYEVIYGTKTKRKQELIKAIKMKGKQEICCDTASQHPGCH